MVNSSQEVRDLNEQMRQLLAYTKQLETAINAANSATARNNLQQVLQERLNQYQKLTEQVKQLQAAESAAAGKRIGEAFRAALAGLQNTTPGAGALAGAVGAVSSATATGARAGAGIGRAVAGRAGGVAGGAIGGTAAAAAGVIGEVIQQFKNLADVSGSLGSALAPFARAVQAFDPGTAQRFALALDNLSAAFGRVFEPIITVGTQFADVLNGVVGALAPTVKPVIELLSGVLKEYAQTYVAAVLPAIRGVLPVFSSLLESVRPLIPVVGETAAQFASLIAEWATTLKPVIESVMPKLVDGLKTFHGVLQEVVAHMRAAVATLGHVIRTWDIRDVAGVFQRALAEARRPALQLPQGQFTTAARQASLTDFAAVGQRARLAAFGTRDPGEATAQNTARTNELLRSVQGLLERLFGREAAAEAMEQVREQTNTA